MASPDAATNQDPLAKRNVFTKADPTAFTPEERGAMRTVMNVVRANAKALRAIGIEIAPTLGRNSRDSSGLAVTSEGRLLLDGRQLRAHFDALGSPEKVRAWIERAVIQEEGWHRHQFRAAEEAGIDFKQHYADIFKEAEEQSPEMVQQAAETYEDFDHLDPHEKGAEIERMVLQGKWHGTLTEGIFKSIERILAYLRGLKIESPLLRESIARVEAVRDEALRQSEVQRESGSSGEAPPLASAQTGSAHTRRDAVVQQQGEKAPSPEPVTPARDPQAKAKLKFTVNDGGFSQDPIVARIMEHGGLLSKTALKEQWGKEKYAANAGESEDAATMAHPSHNALYSKDGLTPDEAVAVLHGDGRDTPAIVKEGYSTADLWRDLERASKSALRTMKQEAAMKRQGTEQRAMDRDFKKETKEKGRGEKEVTAWDVNPGDHVLVGTETMKVVSVDAGNGSFVLEDGKKYGTQEVEGHIFGKLEQAPESLGASKANDNEPRPFKIGSETMGGAKRGRGVGAFGHGVWMTKDGNIISVRSDHNKVAAEITGAPLESANEAAYARGMARILFKDSYNGDKQVWISGPKLSPQQQRNIRDWAITHQARIEDGTTPPSFREGDSLAASRAKRTEAEQRDFLTGTKDDPFNLAGETGVDHVKRAEEKARAERDAQEARAKQEREQMSLFASKAGREEEDYRGEHGAPDHDTGAPLHDLTGGGNVYPADVYGPNGRRYYGTGEDTMDRAAHSLVMQFKGRPNAPVTIYRAVPHEPTNAELIAKYEDHKRHLQRTGKVPSDADGQWPNSSAYYDHIHGEIERLKSEPEVPARSYGVNPGDWVTPIRKYAVDHGESALNGKFKIVSKKVRAKDIFTSGDSWLEWGYDPQGEPKSLAASHATPRQKEADRLARLRETRAGFAAELGAKSPDAETSASQPNESEASRFNGAASGQGHDTAAGKPVNPQSHVLTKPEGRSVTNAYHHLVSKTGFPAVSIAELADQSGVPLDKLKTQLLASHRAGNVVFSKGDWSLASEKVKSGAVQVPGQDRPMLQVRWIKRDEALAASKAKKIDPAEVARRAQENYETRNRENIARGYTESWDKLDPQYKKEEEFWAKRSMDEERKAAQKAEKSAAADAPIGDRAAPSTRDVIGELADEGLVDRRALSGTDSDARTERAGAYFAIGHDAEGGMNWIYDPASRSIKAKEGGTHGSNFGHDVADRSFKGWYDPERNVISVVFPAHEERKLDHKPTVNDIPASVYDKLRAKFGKNTDMALFASKANRDPEAAAKEARAAMREIMQAKVEATRAKERERADAAKQTLREKSAEKVASLRDKMTDMVSKVTAYQETLRQAERAGAAGVKRGVAETRAALEQADRWFSADMHRVKDDMVAMVKESLPPEERGHFIAQIASVLTDRPGILRGALNDATKPFRAAFKLMGKIQLAGERVYRRGLQDEIRETTKRALASKTVDIHYQDAIRKEVLPHISELPTGALEALLGKVKFLEDEGRGEVKNRRELVEAQKAADLAALKTEKTTPYDKRALHRELAPLKPGEKSGLTGRQRMENFVRQALDKAEVTFHRALMPMDALFEYLSGGLGKYSGWLFRKVRNPLDLAHNERTFEERQAVDPFNALVKKHGITRGDMKRLGVYATDQQEGGRERLKAMGYSDAHIEAIAKSLTPGERELYAYARKAVDSNLPRAQAVMRDLYNIDVPAVEHYWPMPRDHAAYVEAEERPKMPGDPDSFDMDELATWKNIAEDISPKNTTQVEKGMTKERQKGAKTAINLDFGDVFRRHMANVLHLIHSQPELKRIGEMVRTPQFAEKYGKGGRQEVMDWLDTVARNGGVDAFRRIWLLDVARKASSVGMIPFRVASTFKHASNAALAIAHVGPEWYMRGLSQVLSTRAQAFLNRHFAETAHRSGGEPAIEELSKMSRVAAFGFSGIRAIDQVDAQAAALGYYMRAIAEKGLDPNRYDSYPIDRDAQADALVRVRRAVASAAAKDKPQVLSRGRGMGGNVSVSNSFFQFGNVFLDRWSNIALDMGSAALKGESKRAAIATLGILAAVAAESGIVVGVHHLTNWATGQQDKDDEHDFVHTVGHHALRQVPYLSQGLQAALYKETGVPVIDSTIGSAHEGYLAATVDDPKKKAVHAVKFVGGVAGAFGVPGAGQATDLIAGKLKATEENDTQRLMRKGGIKRKTKTPEGQPTRKDMVANVRGGTAPREVFKQAVASGVKPEQARSAVKEGLKNPALVSFERLPLPAAIEVYKRAVTDPKITPELRLEFRRALQRKHADAKALKAA